MATSLNKVCLLGNVGKDPEIRNTQNGNQIANLTLATSESWKEKSSGERKERTEWHKITVWNQHLIPVIEKYVKKGSKLYIEGTLQTHKWQAQDGTERYTTEVVLNNFGGVLLLLSDSRGGGSSEPSARAPAKNEKQRYDDLDEEIPF